ncbi:MAG: FHA domain-containing protein [Firmicutes bacterium]|nr:FHA domain-containing protein [Bacillota bacterium]
MTPIQIQILAGRQAGRRVVLQQSPITFGREADNDLLIDMPFVSRRHGELRFDSDSWFVLNQSPNGMKVGRRVCKDMPVAVSGTQTLSIGTDPILRVTPQPGATVGEEPTTADDPEATGDVPQKKGISKTWIGIGVYLVLVIVAVAFFATLKGNDNESTALRHGDEPVELTDQEIQLEILAPLPPEKPDERTASRHLQAAKNQLARMDIDEASLYEAHDSFRRAIAFSADRRLPSPIDERRHEFVQRKLIDEITKRYRSAVNEYRGGDPELAEEEFEELTNIYRARRDKSPLARSIYQHEVAATRKARGG